MYATISPIAQLPSLKEECPLTHLQEYLQRPTDPANWWPAPNTQILGGRDLHRAEHGTWLGVTRQGRLACLTNFKEEEEFITGKRSRGAVVNSYLKMDPESTESSRSVANGLIQEGLNGIGGFSLLFGHLKRPSWKDNGLATGSWDGLAIVSNRSKNVEDVRWLCTRPGETHALSNTHYGDKSWPKVVAGEAMANDAIAESAKRGENKDLLLQRLLAILDHDTLPLRKVDEGWVTYTSQMKTSIFVPAIGDKKQSERLLNGSPLAGCSADIKANVDPATSGVYGTQKQSILLVDWEGKVDYFERTLFNQEAKPIPKGTADLHHEFVVEGWND
ncbi:hypothetical protein BT63DRAFT_155981 [Microthyrium microscopicum]|uniref:DUF833-domain-containing protein n=1 Tax=Microthyrium microscopicum TaxID=703497 RepID=A0A6A6UPQ1_9PEZI|nr:hypothetical protein BT63DRAFT_155981 [Microthyrium microscopicum]